MVFDFTHGLLCSEAKHAFAADYVVSDRDLIHSLCLFPPLLARTKFERIQLGSRCLQIFLCLKLCTELRFDSATGTGHSSSSSGVHVPS